MHLKAASITRAVREKPAFAQGLVEGLVAFDPTLALTLVFQVAETCMNLTRSIL